MSDSDDDLANEYRQAAVEELQNVCSKVGDVDSTLEAIHSTVGDVHSKLGDVEFTVEKIESKLGELDSTLGDINFKLQEANDNLEKIQATLDDVRTTVKEGGSYEWILIVAIIFLIESWPGSKPNRFTDRVWYSMANNADWQNVDIQRRPSDCDFLHAPIGSKRCSYRKEKTVFDEAERQKLLTQAQTQEDRNEISKRPNSVTVYWAKKDEP